MRKIHSILASLGINGLTFVDAGAKDSLEYIQELDSITEIHAFEPNPDEFQTLQKLYSNHSFKKLKLNQIGLSNTNGGADFTITNHASMSSLLNPDLENYKKHFGAYSDFHKWETSIVAHNKVRIEVQTLDSYFANEELTLDYLKLDTQGSELLILQGAEDLISSGKVSVIKVEVSTIAIYKNQALFSDIDLFLRKYNYVLVDFVTYRDNYIPLFGSKSVKAHYAPCGDAIYMLNKGISKPANLKKALILNWLGYKSIAISLLNDAGYKKEEYDFLLSKISKKKFNFWKNAIKNICPPILLRLIKS